MTQDNEKQTPTWEILALIIGFIGSASLVPELVNLIFNFYPTMQEAPRSFKLICIGIYLVFLVVLASRHLYRFHIQHNENTESDEEKFKKILRRITFINFFRQFPLSVFNYFIFKYYKLWSYDLFKKSPEWGDQPTMFNQVGRFRIEDRTVELQFPKNFEKLHLRETSKGSDNFGSTSYIDWVSFQYRLLSITSWFGLCWTINHLNVRYRVFSKLIFFLAVCYFVGFALHLLDVFNLRMQFSDMNTVWKSWIIFLLIFDFIASVGLFLKRFWGEIFFLIVAITQLIAYTQFQYFFFDQGFLIQFHIVCLGLYGFLKILEAWRISMIDYDKPSVLATKFE